MASADSDELRYPSAADEEPVSVARNRRKPPVQESQETASADIQGSQDKLPKFRRKLRIIDGFPCYAASCKFCFVQIHNARKSAFLHLFIEIDKREIYNFGTYCPFN